MSDNTAFPILIVDDDHDAGQNLGDILVDLGYSPDVAIDGPTALQLAQQRRYAVALLDLKMPGMDGLTLSRKLKELDQSIVVILTTAYANKATLASAQSYGIKRVFSKPLDLQQIIPYLLEVSKQPLVLLVDDDSDICRSLTDVLEDRGYRVCFATAIGEALSLVQSNQFQVVLIDMKLPGGYGDEVFQQVRTVSQQARVVLMTGHRTEMEDRIRRSLAAGADAVCYKPFQMPELLTVLQVLATAASGDSNQT